MALLPAADFYVAEAARSWRCAVGRETTAAASSTQSPFVKIFLQQVRRGLELALQRGWAKLMLDCCRDFD